jgi:hypothetical protein
MRGGAENGEGSNNTELAPEHAIPLRSYLQTLTPDCRRKLLEALEESALRGAPLLTGTSEATVAYLLSQMERAPETSYPALWRAVCFPTEHALTDAWVGLTRWDIPRVMLGGLYTYTRVRLPEWSMMEESFRSVSSEHGRYLVMCAAMALVGAFIEREAEDGLLVEALRRRTDLDADAIVRSSRLFARLVAVGPGFLDSIAEAFEIPVEELTCLPLLPAEMRRPVAFDAGAIKSVAGRYVKLPAAIDNQNQLVATQTALLLRNPSEILNLIPPRLRSNEDELVRSGFLGICEYVISRLERHAREIRFFMGLWNGYAITDEEYLPHVRNLTDLAEQYGRESQALARLVRLGPRSPLGVRVREAERDVIDCLIHMAMPICWIGVQSVSVYALLPLSKPRLLPSPTQQESEKQLFRFITAVSPLIERGSNRMALSNLRSTVNSLVNSLMTSIKPSWFLSYRTDRAEAIAMTGHVICILSALERVADARALVDRLVQQRIPPAEAVQCKGNCRHSCAASSPASGKAAD